MTALAFERVLETTTTTGTGDLTLAGAAPGMTTFASALALNDGFHYSIFGGGSEWETGYGHLSATSTLVRDAVIASSNSDALVSFSAGSKYVAIVSPNVGANAVGLSLFGDGADGDVTISSGTTLSRDMHYRNLTITAGPLRHNGYRVFVSGILDLTGSAGANGGAAGLRQGASPGAGNAAGTAGTAGASGTAGALGVFVGGTAGGLTGLAGGAGGVTTGSNAANGTTQVGMGGRAGNGGAGGQGTGGGTGGTRGAITANSIRRPITDASIAEGIGLLCGGQQAPGGGGGGGDGTSGGGGGGGGAGGGALIMFARTINRTGSTAAGQLFVDGVKGGNGGAPAAGNRGGGGGGGGSGGGWILLVYEKLIGSASTGALSASGGDGGNGGNGSGTGTGGNGGNGGEAGRITVIDLGAGTVTETGPGPDGGTGNAHSGATGGTGGTGGANKVNL